jgi:hypothetical protein
MGKGLDKQANNNWEEYRLNLLKETTVDVAETDADKLKRIKRLEADDEAWFEYYFPNYYKSKPAPFQVKATKRLLDPLKTRWYEVRTWSRGLAKTTRAMMEFFKLAMTGRIRNTLIISNSYDNAERLSMPFKINLECNSRLINDYGIQERPGNWEDGEFVTRKGWSIRAVGAGQSPRGTKNEDVRPDSILVDDIDTDEETRNPDRIDTKWAWIEKAVIPTVDISGTIFILFCGNIIAKHCCITEAIKRADFTDTINIRDKKGKSAWPEKNSEEDIDYILSKLSYAAAQQEYYNNPVREGSVFKNIVWDAVPRLEKFRFLVAYGDPSQSNKENKDGSYKALTLIGLLDNKFYIVTCFLEQAKNSKFITWYFDLENYIEGKTQLYNYIENNSLQDPFYEQVISPLLLAEGAFRKHYVHVSPDERKKPDKFARIEGNLEHLNRTGRLIFNIAEKNNPHMQRLEEQFKAVDPKLSAHVDGPDAVEGGVWIINNKMASMGEIKSGKSNSHSKRY